MAEVAAPLFSALEVGADDADGAPLAEPLAGEFMPPLEDPAKSSHEMGKFSIVRGTLNEVMASRPQPQPQQQEQQMLPSPQQAQVRPRPAEISMSALASQETEVRSSAESYRDGGAAIHAEIGPGATPSWRPEDDDAGVAYHPGSQGIAASGVHHYGYDFFGEEEECEDVMEKAKNRVREKAARERASQQKEREEQERRRREIEAQHQERLQFLEEEKRRKLQARRKQEELKAAQESEQQRLEEQRRLESEEKSKRLERQIHARLKAESQKEQKERAEKEQREAEEKRAVEERMAKKSSEAQAAAKRRLSQGRKTNAQQQQQLEAPPVAQQKASDPEEEAKRIEFQRRAQDRLRQKHEAQRKLDEERLAKREQERAKREEKEAQKAEERAQAAERAKRRAAERRRQERENEEKARIEREEAAMRVRERKECYRNPRAIADLKMSDAAVPMPTADELRRKFLAKQKAEKEKLRQWADAEGVPEGGAPAASRAVAAGRPPLPPSASAQGQSQPSRSASEGAGARGRGPAQKSSSASSRSTSVGASRSASTGTCSPGANEVGGTTGFEEEEDDECLEGADEQDELQGDPATEQDSVNLASNHDVSNDADECEQYDGCGEGSPETMVRKMHDQDAFFAKSSDGENGMREPKRGFMDIMQQAGGETLPKEGTYVEDAGIAERCLLHREVDEEIRKLQHQGDVEPEAFGIDAVEKGDSEQHDDLVMAGVPHDSENSAAMPECEAPPDLSELDRRIAELEAKQKAEKIAPPPLPVEADDDREAGQDQKAEVQLITVPETAATSIDDHDAEAEGIEGRHFLKLEGMDAPVGFSGEEDAVDASGMTSEVTHEEGPGKAVFEAAATKTEAGMSAREEDADGGSGTVLEADHQEQEEQEEPEQPNFAAVEGDVSAREEDAVGASEDQEEPEEVGFHAVPAADVVSAEAEGSVLAREEDRIAASYEEKYEEPEKTSPVHTEAGPTAASEIESSTSQQQDMIDLDGIDGVESTDGAEQIMHGLITLSAPADNHGLASGDAFPDRPMSSGELPSRSVMTTPHQTGLDPTTFEEAAAATMRGETSQGVWQADELRVDDLPYVGSAVLEGEPHTNATIGSPTSGTFPDNASHHDELQGEENPTDAAVCANLVDASLAEASRMAAMQDGDSELHAAPEDYVETSAVNALGAASVEGGDNQSNTELDAASAVNISSIINAAQDALLQDECLNEGVLLDDMQPGTRTNSPTQMSQDAALEGPDLEVEAVNPTRASPRNLLVLEGEHHREEPIAGTATLEIPTSGHPEAAVGDLPSEAEQQEDGPMAEDVPDADTCVEPLDVNVSQPALLEDEARPFHHSLDVAAPGAASADLEMGASPCDIATGVVVREEEPEGDKEPVISPQAAQDTGSSVTDPQENDLRNGDPQTDDVMADVAQVEEAAVSESKFLDEKTTVVDHSTAVVSSPAIDGQGVHVESEEKTMATSGTATPAGASPTSASPAVVPQVDDLGVNVVPVTETPAQVTADSTPQDFCPKGEEACVEATAQSLVFVSPGNPSPPSALQNSALQEQKPLNKFEQMRKRFESMKAADQDAAVVNAPAPALGGSQRRSASDRVPYSRKKAPPPIVTNYHEDVRNSRGFFTPVARPESQPANETQQQDTPPIAGVGPPDAADFDAAVVAGVGPPSRGTPAPAAIAGSPSLCRSVSPSLMTSALLRRPSSSGIAAQENVSWPPRMEAATPPEAAVREAAEGAPLSSAHSSRPPLASPRRNLSSSSSSVVRRSSSALRRTDAAGEPPQSEAFSRPSSSRRSEAAAGEVTALPSAAASPAVSAGRPPTAGGLGCSHKSSRPPSASPPRPGSNGTPIVLSAAEPVADHPLGKPLAARPPSSSSSTSVQRLPPSASAPTSRPPSAPLAADKAGHSRPPSASPSQAPLSARSSRPPSCGAPPSCRNLDLKALAEPVPLGRDPLGALASSRRQKSGDDLEGNRESRKDRNAPASACDRAYEKHGKRSQSSQPTPRATHSAEPAKRRAGSLEPAPPPALDGLRQSLHDIPKALAAVSVPPKSGWSAMADEDGMMGTMRTRRRSEEDARARADKVAADQRASNRDREDSLLRMLDSRQQGRRGVL
eukprot:gnl/TRDRNA2_/TRDRNA2_176678_c3_seq5.p1 gnl/TRDRNA2_/TRDRNA2_176678_c3~~gnl/TRDRNA2_/TRDRNA2_176678_c3_seq5.p1  ORF type:complete len:2107 (+),score=520.22 gnl/TRDRNA2_/TRDRNA2_176678_c3_seq5:39-6359(+)